MFTPRPHDELRYLVIHEVSCRAEGDGHERHESTTLFLDTPRLFASDSKASILRGLQQIDNLEVYLELNPGIGFVVTRYYGCGDYYASHGMLFERIGDARLLSEITLSSRPYLYRLAADGPLAVPRYETMGRFSSELVLAMSAADRISPGMFNEPEEISEPYINIYHSRGCFEVTKMGLISSHILELENLLAYVFLARGHDFAEADDLFRQGRVSKSHFSKLFRPGELIVRIVDGEETVAKCETSTDGGSLNFHLSCWSWHFDGLFSKKHTITHVYWPDRKQDVLPVTALSAYPLRLGDPKLRGSLERRGEVLWSCRFRRFVGYAATTSALEETAVRSLVIAYLLLRQIVMLTPTDHPQVHG